ncbi:hypothetical protein GCM10009080_57510 [Cupriavidus pauculus]
MVEGDDLTEIKFVEGFYHADQTGIQQSVCFARWLRLTALDKHAPQILAIRKHNYDLVIAEQPQVNSASEGEGMEARSKHYLVGHIEGVRCSSLR